MNAGRHSRRSIPASGAAGVDERILRAVRDKALATGGALDAIALADAVHDAGTAWGTTGTAQILKNLQDEVQGLSVLEPFAATPGVSDVLVDGQGQVWTDSNDGLKLTGFRFSTAEQVRQLAVHFATLAGRRLDEGSPYVDVGIRNYRIHAVLPPIAVDGPLISIRVKHPSALSLDELLVGASRWWKPILQSVVRQQMNFLISGGTGTGKTTLLQAMLGLVEVNQRLVIVEDSHELQVAHPHVLSLQSRPPNVEFSGQVTLTDLVIQALRMRPDRLIVGECRGAEIRDFLAAMNTGHQGAAGTIHANDLAAVPARLAALGALAGWDTRSTAMQANSALDLFIHLSRSADGQRAPQRLGRLGLGPNEQITVHPLIDASLEQPFLEGTCQWLRDRLGQDVLDEVLALHAVTRREVAP